MAKTKSEFRALLVYPNLPGMLVPSLAIGIFTKILKQQGYIVDLFDTTHYISDVSSSPHNRVKFLQAREFNDENDLGVTVKAGMLDDFRSKVLEFQPDVMIVSVVEDVFQKTLLMLDAVSDLNVAHLLGGVFPTAAPDFCLEFPQVKLIGVGEGEAVIVEVAEALRLGTPLEKIAGTHFKDDAGVIHRNHRPPLVDLDTISPDFSLFAAARFYRPMGGRIFKTLPVETYRGCPYLCTFCNSPMNTGLSRRDGLGNFLRRKKIAVLEQELEAHIKLHSPEFLYFIDDSFLARPVAEIFEFCDMYEKFKLPFWFNTRIENVDAKKLERLKQVGCYRISFGLECGNEEYRKKVLKRHPKNEELIAKFAVAAESGIAFSVNLIIGFPGETRDLVMDTVEFTRTIQGYDSLTVSIFTPYHGTELHAVAVKNGWLDAKSLTVHTTSSSMLRMPAPYLSADDIDGLVRVLPLYCYFPKSDWEVLKRAETDDAEGNRILEKYSEIYKVQFLKGTQDDEKEFLVVGGTGCRTNPKDSFRSIGRLTPEQIDTLTLAAHQQLQGEEDLARGHVRVAGQD